MADERTRSEKSEGKLRLIFDGNAEPSSQNVIISHEKSLYETREERRRISERKSER